MAASAVQSARDALPADLRAAQPERPPLRRRGLLVWLAVLLAAGALTLLSSWYRATTESDLIALERSRAPALAAQRTEPAPALDAFNATLARLRGRERAIFWACVGGGAAALLWLGVALRIYSRRLDGTVAALAARERELEVERRKVFHQEKMAAVGAMAAGVLHDIGNPIAAIDGVARAMQEAATSGDAVIGEGLCDPGLILRETARLQSFTRMIAGLAATQSTEPQLLNVNELVQTGLLLLQFDPRLAGVRIQTELDPQLPAITGVSDSLLQLISNLLVNAADAVRSPPRERPLIDVKTGIDPAGIRLTIADNGCGMSEEVLQRAFEPMFTTKPAGRGTGLGLPLVRTIAEAHGGDVTIDSAPGRGARVTVRLALRPAGAH